MTRTEMIGFVREHPLTKVTHTLFSKDEYIYSKGDGCIYEEHGYLFEDWISERSNGIRMRSGDLWETGWSLYEEGVRRETKPRKRSVEYYRKRLYQGV